MTVFKMGFFILATTSGNVTDPFSTGTQLEEGQDHDDHKQDISRSTCLAHSLIFVKFVKDIINHGHTAVVVGSGQFVIQNEYLGEYLKITDDGDNENEKGGGRQQRPSDVSELLDFFCPVNLCRLIIEFIDGLQSGQEDDGVVAYHFPYGNDGDGGNRPDLIGK